MKLNHTICLTLLLSFSIVHSNKLLSNMASNLLFDKFYNRIVDRAMNISTKNMPESPRKLTQAEPRALK